MDFRTLPIGTNVYCSAFGNGKINSIITDRNTSWPINCMFDGRTVMCFTASGQYALDGPVCLTLNEYVIPPEAFIPKRPDLKVDDRIWVRDSDEGKWLPMHFAGWRSGGLNVVCTYNDGGTSFTRGIYDTTMWPYYRLTDPDNE